MFVATQRTTAWQSDPKRLVNTPTSASSKKATSCRMMARNNSALHTLQGGLLAGGLWFCILTATEAGSAPRHRGRKRHT